MSKRSNRPVVLSRRKRRSSDEIATDKAKDIILVQAYMNGGHRSSQAAYNALLDKHMGMLLQMCRRYANKGLPFDDLMQHARIGFMIAVRRYNGRSKLTTYAPYWIRCEILSALGEESNAHPGFRVPANEFRKAFYVHRAQAALINQGMNPRDPDLLLSVIRCGEGDLNKIMTRKDVARCLEIMGEAVRLDAVVIRHGGDTERMKVVDLLSDPNQRSPESETVIRDVYRDVMKRFGRLDPNQQQVLDMRFGITSKEPLKLNEIGKIFQVTRERIRQIESQALSKLGMTHGDLANLLEAYGTVTDSAA